MAVDVGTYAAKQRVVSDAAEEVLGQWLAANPGATLAEVTEEVIAIAGQYGSAAAEMAVEFYADWREAALEIVDWEPEPATVRPDKYITKMVGNFYDPSDQFLSGLLDAVNVAVQQVGRDTIVRNAKRDPAKARWARVPIGKTCAWCLMLASRGAAYLTKQSAGGASNVYHPSCDCQPVPVWPGKGGKYKAPYNEEKLTDIYQQALVEAGGSGASGKAVARAIRDMFPDLITDGHAVPSILTDVAKGWPSYLEPVRAGVWRHILIRHLSGGSARPPHFEGTAYEFARAIQEVVRNPTMDVQDSREGWERVWNLVKGVNGQEIQVGTTILSDGRRVVSSAFRPTPERSMLDL